MLGVSRLEDGRLVRLETRGTPVDLVLVDLVLSLRGARA